MNKIKDLIYDKNDILVAMLILCIAGVIIFARVNSIMGFPERMIAFQGPGSGTVNSIVDDEPGGDIQTAENVTPPPIRNENNTGISNGEISDENGDTDSQPDANGAADSNGEDTPVVHSLHIASGQSMTAIANNLVSLGLFENTQAFIATLEAHNAAARVQAGNFTIPSDSTHDDVIRIITSRPGS